MFNSLRIEQRGEEGELSIVILRDALAPLGAGQVPGTRSQFIEYVQGSSPIAKCHRYLKPDGTIGGHGRPDPKWLVVSSEIWTPSHFDFERCPDCP
jgi:hypothetical protein